MVYSSPSIVTVSVTATTTSALPTISKATAPALKCPDNNNTRYTPVNNPSSDFTIGCDIDYPFNDLEDFNSSVTLNMDDCIEQCAYFNKVNAPATPCVGAVFRPFETHCWIKRYIGTQNTENSYIVAVIV